MIDHGASDASKKWMEEALKNFSLTNGLQRFLWEAYWKGYSDSRNQMYAEYRAIEAVLKKPEPAKKEYY